MARRPVVIAGLIATLCVGLAITAHSPAQDAGGHSSEIKNRVGRWQSDPALRPFTAGLPDPAPVTPPTLFPPAIPPSARTRIAICYGVNEVDPAYYGGPNRLGACENDASAMARTTKSLGFETTVRLTRDATSANLFADLRRAASRLQSGDHLIVTYAGHGSRVRDENGDEAPSTEDSTWCLYDRMVIDDELGVEWTRFRAGVRIYVVADSCHSGTSVRALARGKNPNTRSRGASALSQRDNTAEFKVRTLFPDEQKAAAARQFPLYGATWRNTPGFDESMQNIRASALLLAACDDDETAGESGQHGLFTAAMLRTVQDGRFTGTYQDLINQASRLVNDPNQHPKLLQFGAIGAVDIERERPFAP